MPQTAALHAGLSEFDTPQAWYGPELTRGTDWIHELSDLDRQELRKAITVAQASGRPLHELGRAHFPLASLAARLSRLRHEALDGRGFFLLRACRSRSIRLGKVRQPLGHWAYQARRCLKNGKGHAGTCGQSRPGLRRPGGPRVSDRCRTKLPYRLFGPGWVAVSPHTAIRWTIHDRQLDDDLERDGEAPPGLARMFCWNLCTTHAGARSVPA